MLSTKMLHGDVVINVGKYCRSIIQKKNMKIIFFLQHCCPFIIIYTLTPPYRWLYRCSGNSDTASKEFRQEISRFWIDGCPEVVHNMSLLLPPLHSFNKFHLALNNQHINNSYILSMSVFLKFFPQLGTTLGFILRNIVLQNCEIFRVLVKWYNLLIDHLPMYGT